ncbi:MAG: hypothetical protein AB1391_02040 [Candidatus Micrarchaeota archaeon]
MNEKLNTDFKKVCKLLFGSEIGDLKDFEPWLKEAMVPYKEVKSIISGKEVMIAGPYWPNDAKFISQDEIGKVKLEPLNINEIKDIDSLFRAVKDKIIYCGNRTFGKNFDVEKVDNCIDCSDVYYAHNIHRVKYGAYCSSVRDDERVYGGSAVVRSNHVIRCVEVIGIVRCFETHYATSTMDTFYCLNVSGCSNCMFTFNQKAKSYLIGNLQLTKEKYLELKTKLVSEMAEKLKKDKRLFSIADIVKTKTTIEEVEVAPSPVPQTVEKAFSSTMRIVLGKEYKDSRQLAPWLLKKVLKVKRVRAVHGKHTYWVDLPIVKNLAPERLLAKEEAFQSSKDGIEIKNGEPLSLDEVVKKVAEKAYFTFEFTDGNSLNVVDVPNIFNGTNAYLCWDITDSMYAGYTSSPVGNSKYIFGGGYIRILSSEFCVSCYDISNCKNCLEIEGCSSSSELCFSHNCENIMGGIFCFNAKGLRYAIGNIEVGRDEFLRVKKILLDYVNNELEKNNRVNFDIFTLTSFFQQYHLSKK